MNLKVVESIKRGDLALAKELEDLAAEVKSGEITAYAIAFVKNGSVLTGWSYAKGCNEFHKLNSGCAVLASRMAGE